MWQIAEIISTNGPIEAKQGWLYWSNVATLIRLNLAPDDPLTCAITVFFFVCGCELIFWPSVSVTVGKNVFVYRFHCSVTISLTLTFEIRRHTQSEVKFLASLFSHLVISGTELRYELLTESKNKKPVVMVAIFKTIETFDICLSWCSPLSFRKCCSTL